MRIKFKRSGPILLAIVVMIFFGYLGYRDFADVDVSAAESAVEAKIEKMDQKNENNSKYYGVQRARVALEQLRLDVSEQPDGCNCGPVVDTYTEGERAQWCAMFASWVTKEAGSPLYGGAAGASWRIKNSRDLAEYLRRNGTWHDRKEVLETGVQPQEGDMMIFWRGDFEDNLGHVDIVVSTNGPDGTAGLVGGNVKNRVAYRNIPYKGNYGFLGFGHPEKD